MKRILVWSGILGIIIAASILFFALPVFVQERGVQPAGTPVKVFAIPPSAFERQAAGCYGGECYYHYSNETLYLRAGITDNGIYYAPVILPNWSKITKIVLYCKDNGTSLISLKLKSSPHDQDTSTAEATVSSTGSSSTFRKFEQTTNIRVANRANTYQLRLFLPPAGPTYVVKSVLIYYSDAQW